MVVVRCVPEQRGLLWLHGAGAVVGLVVILLSEDTAFRLGVWCLGAVVFAALAIFETRRVGRLDDVEPIDG